MKTKTVLLFAITGCIIFACTGYFLFPSIFSISTGSLRVSVSEITQQFSTRFIYSLACAAIIPLALITVIIFKQLSFKNLLTAFAIILAGHILGVIVNCFRLRSINSQLSQNTDITPLLEWNSIRINEFPFAGMIGSVLICSALFYAKKTRTNS
jgi:glucan phosphoethanolaminetransferase (alkaline phosphatase superfamily)